VPKITGCRYWPIAEVVGDGWPERAREAMMVLEGIADSESIKQILLQDIRDVFDEKIGYLLKSLSMRWLR